MVLVDSHIHLYEDEYRDILDKVISEAYRNKVDIILCVSEDVETSIETINLSDKYRLVYAGIGVHPWSAIYTNIEWRDLDDLLDEYYKKVKCIGEVGLDGKYDMAEKRFDRQLECFKHMVKLSVKYGLPLNIHSRRAEKQVLRVLGENSVEKAHLHWFTGSIDILREALSLGYYVSFTPSITYSKRIMKIASSTPLERILTETDGPIRFYGELRDQLTMPHHVKHVIKKLAEIHKIEEDEVARIILDNFNELYR